MPVLVKRCYTRVTPKETILVPSAGALKFARMDTLGLLLHTMCGNQFLAIITDRYSKLKKSIPRARTTATQIVTIFLDHWVIQCRNPLYLSANNGPQIAWHCFTAFCSFLGLVKPTMTACHPQTSRKGEGYSCMIVVRLLHHVGSTSIVWNSTNSHYPMPTIGQHTVWRACLLLL